MFDRTADETMEWVEEKAATLSAEGFGQDLETIQALIRKHEAFESELAAVRSQVEAVKLEARRLAKAFPDTQDHVEVKCDEVRPIFNFLVYLQLFFKETLSLANVIFTDEVNSLQIAQNYFEFIELQTVQKVN